MESCRKLAELRFMLGSPGDRASHPGHCDLVHIHEVTCVLYSSHVIRILSVPQGHTTVRGGRDGGVGVGDMGDEEVLV